LTCVNARSGVELWRSEYVTDYVDMYEFSNGPRAAPLIDGDHVYTFGVEGRLRCLRVKDGSLVWEVDTSSVYGKVDFLFPFRSKKFESVNAANPIVVGDTVFVTESYGVGSVVLRVKPGQYEVVRRDASRRNQSMSCHFMTPVYHEGYLYGSSGEGSGAAELRAVEYETGKIAWSRPGLGRSTVLFVDGHLVVLTERGHLMLVEATLKNPTWSPPGQGSSCGVRVDPLVGSARGVSQPSRGPS